MNVAGVEKDEPAGLALSDLRSLASRLHLALDLGARRQERLSRELREVQSEPAGRGDDLEPFSVGEPCAQNCRLHC